MKVEECPDFVAEWARLVLVQHNLELTDIRHWMEARGGDPGHGLPLAVGQCHCCSRSSSSCNHNEWHLRRARVTPRNTQQRSQQGRRGHGAPCPQKSQ